MDWRGKLTVAVALVAVAVAFSVARFTEAQTLKPQGIELGQYSQFKLPDGMPADLGPAIVDASYRDVNNDNVTANDTLYVVFNRDLEPGSVDAADFRLDASPGGIAAGTLVATMNSIYDNVVNLTGFTTEPGATDSVAISVRFGIDAAGSNTANEDISLIHIKTGPVIAMVRMTDGYYTYNDVADDELTVHFTHPIASGLSTTDASLDFEMAEFGDGTVKPDGVSTAGQMSARILMTDGVSANSRINYHLGRVKPGVSKLRLRAPNVVVGPNSVGNTSTRWVKVYRGFDTDGDFEFATTGIGSAADHIIGHHGPILINAGYNNNGTGGLDDDVLTLVFNRDIMIGTADVSDFDFSGTSPSGAVLGSDDGDHILTLTNFVGSSLAIGTDVVGIDDFGPTDYQGNFAEARFVVIHPSPVITLARYNDGAQVDANLHILEIFFDIPVTGSTGDTANFNYFGFRSNGLLVTDNTDNDNILTLVGFTASNKWTPGDQIQIRSGSLLRGYRDGFGPLGAPSDNFVGRDLQPVRDFSPPFTHLYVFNRQYTFDTPNAVGADTARYAYNEAGVDDSDYTTFFTRRNFPVDKIYAQAHFNNAVFVSNPNAGTGAVDRNVITTYDITPVTGTYSDGTPIDTMDVVNFGIIAADCEGNLAFDTASKLFFGGLVAGPVPCPVDFLPGIDDNLIHVYSDGTDRFVTGEANAAPGADVVQAYGEPGFPSGDLLGEVNAAANGSFGPINIGPYDGDFVYLISVDDFGSVCGPPGTAIRNDIYEPTISFALDPLQRLTKGDLCYSAGDTLRILAGVQDPVFGGVGLNDLLLMHADLTEFVTTAGADSAGTIFISMGANQVDDDNDWIDNGPGAFDSNGVKDYPEPFIDENGNGFWNPGEEFIDIPKTGYTANMYDAGDSNLDSNDPDEHGSYYLQYYINGSELVADPTGTVNFAVLKDIPAILHIKDNATSSAAELAKITESASLSGAANANVELITVDDEAFIATEDSQAPTVSEISYLERQSTWTEGTSDPGENIITPGDNVYKLAAGDASPFFNLADSTLSDDDVLLVALQIDPTPNSNSSADFKYIDFDPAGQAIVNGVPGIAEYDDENDVASASLLTNGVDDDEDGVLDNPEEGTDMADPEVVDAMQVDAAADADADGPDGVHRLNDHRDNDNDAFFRMNPISGGYVWFNIDESDTNGVDDDGDGVIDELDEVENYTAINDDDEDGIADGTAVQISVTAGQYLPDPSYSGPIWVKGFTDPANIAKYAGTPGATKPTGLDTYPDELTANDGVPGKRDKNSNVLRGADDWATPIFAYGAPNILSAFGSISANGPGGVPQANLAGGPSQFAFNYREITGRNLNMKVIAALYGLNDGDEYRIRAVAFDNCYQGNPNWAVPLRFTIDSEAPEATIPPAPFDGFVDERPEMDGLQICDVTSSDLDEDGFMDPKTYTLEADITIGDVNDVASVLFQIWDPSLGGGDGAWADLDASYGSPAGPYDYSAPFTMEWTYPGAPLGNDPAALADTLFFRTIAEDKFGNVEAQALCDTLEACFEFEVNVIDCTPPMSCICQIGSDYDPSDGAFVPAESAVDLSAWFTDGDNNPSTNDVTQVIFEYRPVGSDTWLQLPSMTGVLDDTDSDGTIDSIVDPTGIHHPVIYTGPDTLKATVTWDTRDLPTGTYDLRAYGVDIEGNSAPHMTCVFSATIDNVGLRAYIQPCVNTLGSNIDSLFANVYIHDVAVSQVEFQYYADDNGNGLPDDGSEWITIDIQGDGDEERKGDVVLRAGLSSVRDVKNATYRPLLGSLYKFYDVDGDGYNPVDPVMFDLNDNNIYNSGTDSYIIPTGIAVPSGATLTEFAMDEYYASVNGDLSLDPEDWILKDNPLNGGSPLAGVAPTAAADGQVDLWCAPWDVTGINGCVLVRSIATDSFGNVDDDADDDNVTDNDDVIWWEACCIDSDAPMFCAVAYIPEAGGDPIAFPTDATCPLISPQDFITIVAEPVEGSSSSDVDSVRFYYSWDGSGVWEWFATDTKGDSWTGEFPYGEFTLSTDRQINFRAVAYDEDGNFDNDPDACKACVVLAENKGPETDIVLITTSDCDTLDTNTVLRGTENPYCLEPTVLSMLVTVEDNQDIDRVEIWYRKAAGVNSADTTAWAMVPGLVDDTYPYMYGDPNCDGVVDGAPGWDLAGLTDGVYEFFPRGFDANGNETPTFGNPFKFSLSSRSADVVAAEKNGIGVESLTPGEEIVIKAELDDPSDTEGVRVNFWFAERVHGEELTVDSDTYTASTDHTIYHQNTSGMHGAETVWVDGAEATYYELADFLALGAPSATDYTITGPNTLQFGDMDSDAAVTIDYQVTGCKGISLGDNDSPYSVAWDADGGGLVPMPQYSDVTHYDLIATARRSFTDGSYCEELCGTEGFILPLNDTEAPEFIVWGLDYRNPNAPCNALCATCGGNDLVGNFGSCKSKLSGIEHQFFVTGDDDITSVTMAVGGNPAVNFTHYTAEDDTTVVMPITFNVCDLANVMFDESDYAGNGLQSAANGYGFYQAVNPDSIENVTITISGIDVYNVEMTPLGNGWYRYDAELPLGGEYSYSFDIDYVGDDVLSDVADPRCSNDNRSQIVLPGDVWIYSTEDPAALFGINELHQVVVTAMDAEGNTSTNLMTGGDGALGQIWVTYDPIAPVLSSLWLSAEIVGLGDEIEFIAKYNDVVPATTDIITVQAVILQVSVDDTEGRWRTVYVDEYDQMNYDGYYTADGGWSGYFEIPEWMNPSNDGIDNDRDGLTDESDESTYTYKVRAVGVDDCHNYGYSCGHTYSQDPQVCGSITVDAGLPQACLTSPADGSIFDLESVIDLVATTDDTDVAYVQFEYSTDGGYNWNTIDATPLNDDDDPWVVNDGSNTFAASWDVSFLARELAGDFYVSVRANAVDMAGNEQGDDHELNCWINILLNDTTGPAAFLRYVDGPCFEKSMTDPTLALSGDVEFYGYAYGWNQFDVAMVVLEVSSDGSNWTTVGFDNMPYTMYDEAAEFYVSWDTDLVAEGDWYVRVYAQDADGNVTNDEDGDGVSDQLMTWKVRVDHTAPDAMLVRVGPEGFGGTTLEDGDLVRADLLDEAIDICPETPDMITFQATTSDAADDTEINYLTLEFLDDITDVENPQWRALSDNGGFEFRDFPGNDNNPDGKWVMVYDSLSELADDMSDAAGQHMPSREYRFRVRATDYACNTNEASEGVVLRIDDFDPFAYEIYAGDRTTEGGAGYETVHVAGGDVVRLSAIVMDWGLDGTKDGGGLGPHTVVDETSGLHVVQFSYQDGDGNRTVIGLGTYDDQGTGQTPMDNENHLYYVDWTTPMNMAGSTDSLYTIYVEVRDNAGNCGYGVLGDAVDVQDVTPPANSLLVGVTGYEDDCATYPSTMVMLRDQGYGDGIDWTVLSQDLSGASAVGVVAREVMLYAATPAGDASMNGGSVIFEGRRVDGDGAPLADGGWMFIGSGECVDGCEGGEIRVPSAGVLPVAAQPQGPIWTTEWNTLQQNSDGTHTWFDPSVDGTGVQIRVTATDAHGNVEVDVNDAIVQLIVDNVAPEVAVTVHNPTTLAQVGEAERNNPNGVVLLATGGGSSLVNNDLNVTFKYKLSTDIADPASWITLDGEDGIAPLDDNPDHTRPYSFQWDINGHRDDNGKPLTPGACYDIAVEAQDLVCNSISVTAAYKNGDAAELCIVDNTPPVASITHLIRDYSGADCYVDGYRIIENPNNVRINALDQIWARILDGATDSQSVEFLYRKAGTSSWTLADADVEEKNLNNVQTWTMSNWATSPLTEGSYEMVAVATDDAGNRNPAVAPIMTFIVDRTGPLFVNNTSTDQAPTADNVVIVPENLGGDSTCEPDSRVADIFATTADKDIAYMNSWDNCVTFEWKYSSDEDISDNWNSFGMTMYDDFVTRYSTTIDLLDEFGASAHLVDWRVVATDVAGNTTRTWLAKRTVVDNVDPNIEITHVHLDGHDTTIDPINNGQITDVSAGQGVLILATVSDDEPNLPNNAQGIDPTVIDEVQFYVRALPNGDRRFLGTAELDPVLGKWAVRWNTTGLAEGDYEITARATDTAGNCGRQHSPVIASVRNVAVPLASVAAFNPHLKSLITKGTQDRIYGLTLGEKEAATVFFQYRVKGTSAWTTVGVGDPTDAYLSMDDRGQWLLPQELWKAEWVTSTFSAGSQLELRAVATDETPDDGTSTATGGTMALKNRLPGQGGVKLADSEDVFSGLYDLKNTPVLGVTVAKDTFGKTMLQPNENLGYITGVSTRLTGRYIGGGRVTVKMTDALTAPFVVLVGEDGTGAIDEVILDMEPMIDDPTTWVGELSDLESYDDSVPGIRSSAENGGDLMSLDPSEGIVWTVYATAHKARTSEEAPAPRTEMKSLTSRIFKVTVDKGTNGTAGVDGGGVADAFSINVPAGYLNGGNQLGLLINRTDMPKTPANQEADIETIGDVAYEARFYTDYWYVDEPEATNQTKTATVTIRYNEDDLVRGDGSVIPEESLSVRHIDGNDNGTGWDMENISKVQLDTENNLIRFETNDVSDEVFAVVSEERAPFTVHLSPSWNGYTDQDPIINGLIRAQDPDEFDTDTFEIYIDGELAYSNLNDYALYYGSSFYYDYVNGGIAWSYEHSCGNNEALADGRHTMQVSIEFSDSGQPYMSPEIEFWVDSSAPYIEFHSGFVGSPRLGFAAGYVNLKQDIVTVKMYDPGSGLLFREDRIDDYVSNDADPCDGLRVGILCELIRESFPEIDLICFGPNQGDGSFKYDVWVVDKCNGCDGGKDQNDIDEIEERTLIYTGTADALAPYTTPSLAEYTPADTLEVPLAVLTGGNLIQDGSVVEITLYSHKISFVGGSLGGQAAIDDLASLLAGQGLSLTFNAKDEEYVAYVRGPQDNVFNAGSRFVEQRFIVDQTAPTVTPASPGISCDPTVQADPVTVSDNYVFVATFDDAGSGVDPNSVNVRVVGPSGQNIEPGDMNVTASGVTFVITNNGANLEVGSYFITITGTDVLGNAFTHTCKLQVGGTTLSIVGDKIVPNPFSPLIGNALIQFELTKRADVTVVAYDWNGKFVAQIYNGTKDPGTVNIPWSGQTEDGRALGNGVYLIRINVNDGVRQEPRVLKAAIWNER